MRRYENRSTIMTSNRPLEDWGKLLGDVPTAGAILDRFLHHAQTIAITGRSYRVKDALPPTTEKQEAAQVQRTFDRRGRELRLAARPRLVLAGCWSAQVFQKTRSRPFNRYESDASGAGDFDPRQGG